MMRADLLDHRVLTCLTLAGTQITADEIADLVYDDDPTGGPLNASNAIALSVARLRIAGHRIISKIGRAGGYLYVAYDDPTMATAKAISERREQVKVLREMGMSVMRIAPRLGLPPQTVAADLAAVGLGTGRAA